MWQRRMTELVGLTTAGDGLSSILVPRGHVRLWQGMLPWAWWHNLVEWCVEHPGFVRALGASQVVLGAWLCVRASRDLE